MSRDLNLDIGGGSGVHLALFLIYGPQIIPKKQVQAVALALLTLDCRPILCWSFLPFSANYRYVKFDSNRAEVGWK